jgi:hypothetical protein
MHWIKDGLVVMRQSLFFNFSCGINGFEARACDGGLRRKAAMFLKKAPSKTVLEVGDTKEETMGDERGWGV